MVLRLSSITHIISCLVVEHVVGEGCFELMTMQIVKLSLPLARPGSKSQKWDTAAGRLAPPPLVHNPEM